MKIRLLLLLLFVTTLSHAAYVTFSPLTQSVTATSGQTKTVTVTANCIGASTEQVFLEIGLCDADGGFVSGIQSHYIYGGSSVTLTFKFNKTVSSTSSYTYKFSTVSGMTMCDNPSNQIQITVTYVPQVCNLPAPTGLSSVAGLNSIDLSWTKNPNAVQYKLYYKRPTEVPYQQIATLSVANCGSSTCPYTVSGLQFGTTYNFRVEAICANDVSSNPSFITATTLCPSGQPTNLNATPWLNSSYYISFTPMPNVTSYKIEFIDLFNNQAGTSTIYYSSTANEGNNLENIPSGHSFKFRLIGYERCESTYSDWFTYTIPPCSLATPANMSLTNYCGYGVGGQCGYGQFSWSAVTGANRYEVEWIIYNLSGQTVTGSFQTNSTLSVQMGMYSPGASSAGNNFAKFRIRSRCASGAWSDFSDYTTPTPW